MRTILAILIGLLFAFPATAYDKTRVVLSAQEALSRLGYDPGPADGAWGRKTREALNALRAVENLPPAEDLTGSSLALLHRLSPGETTLPEPGFMFTDIPARRDFLARSENGTMKMMQCPARVGAGLRLSDVEPVPRLEMIVKSQGFISQSEDWYSDIQESLLGATNGCLSGITSQCEAVTGFALDWAEADALRPVLGRNHDEFWQTIWIGNVMLRSTITAYGIARQLAEVAPENEAVILDWFKRRVDDYHYSEAEKMANNHTLANLSPALVFGVLVGDKTMMEPALDAWSVALDSMRSDGSLPWEARRGARWTNYTNLQIAQLMFVAELAAGQDINLYETRAGQDKSLQHVIGFLFDGLADFDVALPYAKENHGSPGDFRIPYFDAYHYGWLPAYHARFDNDETMTRIKQATVDPQICSPEAADEEKTAPATCRNFNGEPVSVSAALLAMGLMPFNHMGYPAGCLQGVGVSPFSG